MDTDFIIVGSGFGGSISALRLAEKGYRVVVLEQGRRFAPQDFPRTNWNVRRWMWFPKLGCRGIFKLTILPHLAALSGVGVGGGSLAYASWLHIPDDDFFVDPAWAHLADWKSELTPHYQTALKMLGAARNPKKSPVDEVIEEVGRQVNRVGHFELAKVAVYFGEPGKTVPDPFFGGEGPERAGCDQNGGCLLGCRNNAKNTLDKNYLWLAEKRGARIEADTEVTWVRPAQGGYEVTAMKGARVFGRQRVAYTARNVIFAGGTIGTIPLLLKLKASQEGLPNLSNRLGDFTLSNTEAIMSVVSTRGDRDLSKGTVAGGILQTDERATVAALHYPAGSGLFRLALVPLAAGSNILVRMLRATAVVLTHPWKFLQTVFVRDWAKSTLVLLYMRRPEGHLSLRRGFLGMLKTQIPTGSPRPRLSIPEATNIGVRIAKILDGYPQYLMSEFIAGSPSSAHLLGGARMADSAESGVIDTHHRMFGYDGLYVVDGSAITAHPVVSPSLTISALAERAMALIPPKTT